MTQSDFDSEMSPERRALFDTAWINMQARKVYIVVANGACRAPRSVIHEVHKRFGVKGVAQLYEKLKSLGVQRGMDSRMYINKEVQDEISDDAIAEREAEEGIADALADLRSAFTGAFFITS